MMISKADDGSPEITDELLFNADDDCNDVCIDLDTFWKVMGEPPEEYPQGSMSEDIPLLDYQKGLQNSKDVISPKDESPGFGVLSPSYNSEASDSRTGCSDGYSESAGNSVVVEGERLEPSLLLSLGENPVQCNGPSYTHADGISQIQSSYCQNDSEIAPFETPYHSERLSSRDWYHQIFPKETNLGTSVASMEDASIADRDRVSRDASHSASSSCEINNRADIPDLLSNNGGPYILSSDDPPHFPYSSLYLKKESTEPPYTLPNVFSSKVQDDIKVKKKKIEAITSNEIVSRASEVIGDVFSRKYYGGVKDKKEDVPLESKKRTTIHFPGMVVGENPMKKSAVGAALNRYIVPRLSGQLPPPHPSVKAEINCLKMENNEVPPKLNGGFCPSDISYQGARVRSNTFEQIINLDDDDSDLCILEHMSAPAARPSPTAMMNGKLVAASSLSPSLRDPLDQMAMGHSRLKPNDEQVIFQVALQDLSQPKVETTPPDGALAVSLLKHQRIALAWMVNKETKSACCSGGILADDQGLGKTISTIALMLTERSPSSRAPKTNEEQSETEMLDLDEDNTSPETTYHVKVRPSAGTLIVCPTSVLRQWNEELHNKVSKSSNLSVLVYHGSGRTKDPLELTKYDVVITTYAIVSMEVPKQPVVNEKDDPIGAPFQGFSSSIKKRKKQTSSKKEIDMELLESLSGPLAKVGWFRVVLDEAQSIKNHRTQVARACWGLRAKRRWCLSGTPIQNSIDDLYSYFRFLRHEPYAVFKTFCDQIKVPIHRNPKEGYKKLQAVLKTIMLRRTKGTFIDGEPIINIPPKTIELKRVDFSEEERDFYSRLEADSRAQFAEYAAAGTVKQNYVNILLMLLRLRQACDHPVLVKGFNSNSKTISSIEIAKKLPREKHISLLNCLEASLAICGICSDPPEDAVVTVCGHVFCNQCICEYMIGDDTQCPTKNCKTHLTMPHIFSITTLRIAISDQSSVEKKPNQHDSEHANISEVRPLSRPEDSSKIKAALELLLSLSKPQDFALRNCSEKLHMSEENGNRDMNNPVIKVMGEKAIVFSQWTRMLDLLETCLKDSSVQYRRLDGTMHVAARDRAVKDFNTLPQVSVMIMSLKAASLGLNMVAACHVILLDLWWNPTTEDQAIDRAHRIGQTRPVSVFRLTVKDTVEDRILALQQKKREMVASAFGEDGTGSQQTRLTVDDLKYLFRVD